MNYFLTAMLSLCMFASTAAAQIATGAAATNFTATDALTGEKFSLTDYAGKTVV